LTGGTGPLPRALHSPLRFPLLVAPAVALVVFTNFVVIPPPGVDPLTTTVGGGGLRCGWSTEDDDDDASSCGTQGEPAALPLPCPIPPLPLKIGTWGSPIGVVPRLLLDVEPGKASSELLELEDGRASLSFVVVDPNTSSITTSS
jgi:hypothetical protein